ncbi:MAG: glycosyltransferase [Clostridia bacterium]|nr:glycosyltransferase [Clostridia bacterium]
MRRIVQLNKYYAPHTGGVETVVQNIAEGLKDSTAMQVLVCAPDAKTREDTVNGVAVRRSGRLCEVGPMPVSLRYLQDVRRAAKTADVLHLHMPFPWGDLALRLSGYKGKVALWWHSDVVRQQRLLKLYMPLMRWTLERADVIAVATQGHIDGSAFLKPYESKCRIIPFGVDEAYYAAGAPVAAHPPVNEKTDFLFIGRMVYYKGCDVLLDAFARMREKNCTLTMVGDGVLLEGLRAQALQLGVADRVTFTGAVSKEELMRRIAACDVFVLPSVARSEAFGLVQIETMAYGKPVINTDLPSGVPYVSLDGVTGLTVPPEDASALAAAMDKLAGDAQLRLSYGKAARERVEREYRMETMVARVGALYAALCGEK